jgi:hypothetical protein
METLAFVLISYLTDHTKPTFLDFREVNVSVKYVDSTPVLWGPQGSRPPKPGLEIQINIWET